MQNSRGTSSCLTTSIFLQAVIPNLPAIFRGGTVLNVCIGMELLKYNSCIHCNALGPHKLFSLPLLCFTSDAFIRKQGLFCVPLFIHSKKTFFTCFLHKIIYEANIESALQGSMYPHHSAALFHFSNTNSISFIHYFLLLSRSHFYCKLL